MESLLAPVAPCTPLSPDQSDADGRAAPAVQPAERLMSLGNLANGLLRAIGTVAGSIHVLLFG
jgi:hypothetical protein